MLNFLSTGAIDSEKPETANLLDTYISQNGKPGKGKWFEMLNSGPLCASYGFKCYLNEIIKPLDQIAKF